MEVELQDYECKCNWLYMWCSLGIHLLARGGRGITGALIELQVGVYVKMVGEERVREVC